MQQQRHGAPSYPAALGRRRLTVAAAIKSKSKRQVCCSKTLIATPDTVDQVQRLCADVTAYSQQVMDDRTSGINAFDCVRDQWEPNVFHFWERYDSNVALGRHNTSPEVTKFMEKVVPLLDRPVGMALYEWQDGQLGPVSLQGGPKGEGGLDDATGASGAAGGASMKQTSRSFDLSAIEATNRAETDEYFGMPELVKKMDQQFGQLGQQLNDMVGGLGKLFGSGKK